VYSPTSKRTEAVAFCQRGFVFEFNVLLHGPKFRMIITESCRGGCQLSAVSVFSIAALLLNRLLVQDFSNSISVPVCNFLGAHSSSSSRLSFIQGRSFTSRTIHVRHSFGPVNVQPLSAFKFNCMITEACSEFRDPQFPWNCAQHSCCTCCIPLKQKMSCAERVSMPPSWIYTQLAG